MVVLSYFNIRNLRNADIDDKLSTSCDTPSDVIPVVQHKRS